jgi:hypothetical protein
MVTCTVNPVPPEAGFNEKLGAGLMWNRREFVLVTVPETVNV